MQCLISETNTKAFRRQQYNLPLCRIVHKLKEFQEYSSVGSLFQVSLLQVSEGTQLQKLQNILYVSLVGKVVEQFCQVLQIFIDASLLHGQMEQRKDLINSKIHRHLNNQIIISNTEKYYSGMASGMRGDNRAFG